MEHLGLRIVGSLLLLLLTVLTLKLAVSMLVSLVPALMTLAFMATVLGVTFGRRGPRRRGQ